MTLHAVYYQEMYGVTTLCGLYLDENDACAAAKDYADKVFRFARVDAGLNMWCEIHTDGHVMDLVRVVPLQTDEFLPALPWPL